LTRLIKTPLRVSLLPNREFRNNPRATPFLVTASARIVYFRVDRKG